jgi:hypothetical protein
MPIPVVTYLEELRFGDEVLHCADICIAALTEILRE